jgi:hypothetical protein
VRGYDRGLPTARHRTVDPRPAAALAVGAEVDRVADTHAADTRRALSEPRINAEGIYLVTPSELVRSMSQYDAAIRWIGASVRVSGVVVHIGTSDEARVRRVPPTSTALLSVGPEKRGDPTPPTPESRRTACRV